MFWYSEKRCRKLQVPSVRNGGAIQTPLGIQSGAITIERILRRHKVAQMGFPFAQTIDNFFAKYFVRFKIQRLLFLNTLERGGGRWLETWNWGKYNETFGMGKNYASVVLLFCVHFKLRLVMRGK